MRIRHCWLAVVLLLIPSATRADDHFADAYIAASYAQSSTLWGPHLSFAKTFSETISRKVSVLGDFSTHFGSENGNDVTRATYLFGVRWTYAEDDQARALPELQVAFGGVYTNDGVTDGNDLALALGGAWEYLRSRNREGEGWGFRAQADYVIRRGGDDFPRLSAGVTIRLPKP